MLRHASLQAKLFCLLSFWSWSSCLHRKALCCGKSVCTYNNNNAILCDDTLISDGGKDGFCQTFSDIQNWAPRELWAGCCIKDYNPTQGWYTLQAAAQRITYSLELLSNLDNIHSSSTTENVHKSLIILLHVLTDEQDGVNAHVLHHNAKYYNVCAVYITI